MGTARAVRLPDDAVMPARRIAPATAALGMLLAAAALLLLFATRHLTFFFDEWNFILDRRGGDLSTYLDPHNGHLVLFSVIVYKLLFALVGLRHYTPYLLVLIALHLACGALLYVLARRRVGPWLALAPAALLLFMGTAYQDLLWAFQISFLGSVAAGLAALALLERRQRSADGLAAAMLALSLSSSGVGVAFAFACAALLMAGHGPVRRMWVVAMPVFMFAIWYLGWGTGEHVSSDSFLAAPQYIADAAAGAAAGIAGLTATWGPPLAVAGLAASAMLWSRRLGGTPSPMLLAAAAGALAFWGLAAVQRADVAEPAASRYLYIGAVFILLIAVEVGARARPRALAVAFGLVLLGGALISNLNALRIGERAMRASDSSVRSSLRAIEIAAPVVAPTFVPEPANAPQIFAGPYLSAVRDLGSPALSELELMRAPESVQAHADGVLEQAEALAALPATANATGTQPITVTAAAGGTTSSRGLCMQFDPSGPGAFVEMRVKAGATVLVRTAPGPAASLDLRRFAQAFGPSPFADIVGGRSISVRLPLDRAAAIPWQLRLAATQRVETCLG